MTQRRRTRNEDRAGRSVGDRVSLSENDADDLERRVGTLENHHRLAMKYGIRTLLVVITGLLAGSYDSLQSVIAKVLSELG
jgi:hypothetical protein